MVHLADYVNFSSKSVCGLWIFFFLPYAGNPFQKRDSFQTPGLKSLCSCAYARTEAGWKGKIKLSEAGAACLGIIYLVRGGNGRGSRAESESHDTEVSSLLCLPNVHMGRHLANYLQNKDGIQTM